MATFYVDSAAAGANDGTSWTDAWTSISSSTTVAAGSIIYVESAHDETGAGTFNPDWGSGTNTSPVRLISVDKSDDSYSSRGARIAGTNGFYIAGCTEFYGFQLDSGIGDFYICDNPRENQILDDCDIKVGTGGADDLFFAGGDCTAVVRNSTIHLWDQIHFGGGDGMRVEMDNCIFDNDGASVILFNRIEVRGEVIIRASDMSAWTGGIESTEEFAELHIVDCSVGSGFELQPSGTIDDGCILTLERSHGDTNLTIPKLGLQEKKVIEGTIKSVTAKYRTDGADDGEQANAYSYEMATSANALEFYKPLHTPWGSRWVDGGSSITLTFYVASGGTLNNDDFWIELMSPDETATSTTQADFRSSRMANPQATPAALTTDSSSTWNGTGVGTKQEISFTFTPDIAGPVKFRACLAKPSTTVYYDPRVDGLATGGIEYFANGASINEVGGAGGGGGGGAYGMF